MQLKSARNYYRLFLCLICSFCMGTVNGQQSSAIKFQNNLRWNQIKQEAKKENKYIFIDGYTTWCVPCKYMAAHIFTQKKVADFFNKNFICVAVQFNSTKNDNAGVKNWYHDAQAISGRYKIDAYPTYLFFDPDGSLVHKIVGGSYNADDFIDKSKLALDPKFQLVNLKKKFEQGERDTDFLISLIKVAQSANDIPVSQKATNEYLKTQKLLLTPHNIQLIASATTGTHDPGFSILLNHANEVDKVAGKGESYNLILGILFDEIALPYLRKNGTKTDYGGGMIVYSGDVINDVDWEKLKTALDVKYKRVTGAELLFAKANYYDWTNDWPKYTHTVNIYLLKYFNNVNNYTIDNFASNILNGCNQKQYIDSALNWSKKTLSDLNDAGYVSTYAHLLYKSGRKAQSVKFIEDKMNSNITKYAYLKTLLVQAKNNQLK